MRGCGSLGDSTASDRERVLGALGGHEFPGSRATTQCATATRGLRGEGTQCAQLAGSGTPESDTPPPVVDSHGTTLMTQARFIVLEGVDGSGTTLQSNALTAWLESQGHTVVRTHEPSKGAIGRTIREALRTDAEPMDRRALALLFAADRLHHVQTVIEPALARREVVVCDRYLMSSWAYQALDCELNWVRAINHHAPWPDVTLFLDVPADVALARVRSRDGATPKEIFETDAQQQKVAAIYQQLLEEGLQEVQRIDGTLAPDEVTAQLVSHCRRLGL